jgi:hypothetical protein
MRHDVFRRTVALASACSFALLLSGHALAQADDEGSASSEPSDSTEPSSPPSGDEGASEPEKSHDEEAPSADKDDGSEKEPPPERATEEAPATHERFARMWIGVAGSMDIAFAGAGKDVCPLGPSGGPANSQGIYCTTPSGADFPSRANPMQNATLVPGQAGALDGGPTIGDVRALLAIDYAVTGAILVGLRAGYVFNTYPGTAGNRPDILRHLHLEARGTYVFGRNPLSTVGFAPVAFVGAGVAATDVHASSDVSQVGVKGKTPIVAWQLGGPGVATLGGGARYTFSPRAAFTLAWRFSLAFGSPSALLTTAPEVAFQYGF